MIAIFANTGLAAQKGQSPARWGFYTLLAFFSATTIAGVIYVMSTFKGPQTQAALEVYVEAMQSNPLKSITLTVIGLGGALFVRYRLQQLPDVKKKSAGGEA